MFHSLSRGCQQQCRHLFGRPPSLCHRSHFKPVISCCCLSDQGTVFLAFYSFWRFISFFQLHHSVALRCENREGGAISCCKTVLFRSSVSHLRSHVSSLPGDEKHHFVLLKGVGGFLSFTLGSCGSARLSLMITVTQQVLLLFAPFPPLLCIPALVSLDPSSLPPPLNKSPASEG